jgi:hypothetical protein
MRSVRSAICTSGDPVSPSLVAYPVTTLAFVSRVSGNWSSSLSVSFCLQRRRIPQRLEGTRRIARAPLTDPPLTSRCNEARLHDVAKRTTLTLDDDVAAKLERQAREAGASYRYVVNQVLRRGLEADAASGRPYRVDARPMGRRPGRDVDHIPELIDLLDGPRGR